MLFRSGQAIERLAEVEVIRFDKTGTVTTGTPTVVQEYVTEGTSEVELASRAASLARASTHVFSRAILRRLSEADQTLPTLPASADDASSVVSESETVRTVPGCGVEAADSDGKTTRLGSWDWLQQSGASTTEYLHKVCGEARIEGRSVVAVGWDEKVQGLFVLSETLRPEAAATMQALRVAGYDVALLTGDHATPRGATGGPVAHAGDC